MHKLTCFRKDIKDKRYISIVKPLLDNEEVQLMEKFIQHGRTCTLEHCVNVSYMCYKIARRLDMDYKLSLIHI